VNFERILDAIWTELSAIIYELVQSNLDKRRPPQFFSNLRETMRIMVKSFKSASMQSEKNTSDRATLEAIEQLLQLHGYETCDLIHQYYIERKREQDQMADMPYGMLTVRCCLKDNSIEIEVINARNLTPLDSNGSCDPFIRINFVPQDKFNNITRPKTNAQSKTLFPLFDEKFVVPLTSEQRAMGTALILFCVKDKDLFGITNQYIAECFLTFEDIEKMNNSCEQIHLKLSRPKTTDSDCIRALEHRQGDKLAKDFVKRLKQKMLPP